MATEPTDGELLMRFLQHQDEGAFETLVQRHQASVYGVCYRVLGNSHDAEDAFQATFLVLARKAKRFQTASSIGGWLFRVALRTAKNVRAKKWRSKEETLNVTISPESEPLALIQEQELVTTLYEELDKLPDKYRTPIVLCMLEGKSRLQASTQLECTVASLKARLARGRQQLRINLTRRGVAFSVALTAACSTVSVADAAVGSLCSTTATVCSSFIFAAEGCSISPDIIQLSEKGMSAMTITTYSKLAIASLVLLTIGVGGATLPMPGPGSAHGADNAIDIELKPAKVAQRTNVFTPTRNPATVAQQTQRPRPQRQPLPAAAAVTVSQTSGIPQPVRQNTFTYLSADVTSPSASKVSEEASNEVVEALIEALRDSDEKVTHNAAKTLISIGKGHSEVVTAFSEVAANSKDKKLRYYAIAGLGRVGGGNQDATRSLTKLLERESAPVFRKAAVEALGQVQMSDEVARTLASALRDSDAGVRAAVARVLGRLDPMHNSALQPRLSLPRELNATTAIPSMDLNITPSIEPTDLR